MTELHDGRVPVTHNSAMLHKQRFSRAALSLVFVLTLASLTACGQPYYSGSDNQSSLLGGDTNSILPTLSLQATPELDSVLLFAAGFSGLGGYALLRMRARRRS